MYVQILPGQVTLAALRAHVGGVEVAVHVGDVHVKVTFGQEALRAVPTKVPRPVVPLLHEELVLVQVAVDGVVVVAHEAARLAVVEVVEAFPRPARVVRRAYVAFLP